MTLTNLKSWIYNALGFLKPENNLSEVTAVTARSNLSVYSKASVDTMVVNKANALDTTDANKFSVTLANTVTVPITLDGPTSSYPTALQNPASIKAVLKYGAGVMLRQVKNLGSLGSGSGTITITFPYTLPNDNYIVCGTPQIITGSGIVHISTYDHTFTGFKIWYAVTGGTVTSAYFPFIIFNAAETNL